MNRKRKKQCRWVFAVMVVLLLWGINLFAQGPDTLWTRTYGGINDDQAYSVQQTFDGGYIIAGYTKSFGAGDADVYLVKTDSIGDTLWTRTYGDTLFDAAYSVQQTSDSGFIVAGVKSLPQAVPPWTYTYVYLIKTDRNGDSLWSEIYGWYMDAQATGYSVQQTTNGGYIVVGYIWDENSGYDDVFLIKTDVSGNCTWYKQYDNGRGYAVQQTIDGGYIIASISSVYLIRTDSLGDTLWTKPYAGYSVEQTTDGGYVLVGEKGVNGWDVHLIKTDSLGDTLWTRNYGSIHRDAGYSVHQTIDGGYIIAGCTGWYFDISRVDTFYDADVYLIKTDSFGDTLWTRIYGDIDNDYGRSVEQTSDSGFIVAGYTKSFGAGDYDVYLIKTGADVGVEERNDTRPKTRDIRLTCEPNPFTAKTVIEFRSSGVQGFDSQLSNSSTPQLTIYDVSGRLIRTFPSSLISPHSSATWDGSDGNGIKVPRGIYFVRLGIGNLTSMKKVVLVR